MTEPHDPYDGAMDLVRRLAMLVLSSPAEEREVQYDMARELGYQAAIQAGLMEDEALDAGATLEFWTRTLVDSVLDADARDSDTA